MQSMFRLPWSTDSPGAKIMENATLHKSRPMPVVEIPQLINLSKLKRKPTDSPEPAAHGHVPKKWKIAGADGEVKAAPVAHGVAVTEGAGAAPEAQKPTLAHQMPETAPAEVLETRPKAQPSRRESAAQANVARPPKKLPNVKPGPASSSGPTPAMDAHLTGVQQAVEAQINYEILLKHNELRLIEQELAKCQVALEQLRRCALIPFPGHDGPSLDVSRGMGAALQPPSGYTEPSHPAPWGVTDGPYAHHYAKWLLPDPKFDPVPERSLAHQSQDYFGMGEGRTTRGSFAQFGSTGKARTSRTSTGTLKLQVLGENPPPPPKVDQLLHKRSTDGQWVRLYCAICEHSRFNNTQGFLNHCRIKHNQVYKSHDQAAVACGIPVDVDSSGNPISATEPPSAATPAPTPAATSMSTPTPIASGAVHSLVRTNPPEWAKDVHRDFNKPPPDQDATLPRAKAECGTSPSTPHLNSFLGKKGFAGDLRGLVDTAKLKVDLSSIESLGEDREESVSQTPTARSDIAATPSYKLASARPGAKGQGAAPARLPHIPSPVHVGSPADTPPELSPHPAESNPGLVSDNDDDDDEDGYDTRSQTDMIMDDAFVVEDASDVEGAAARASSRKGLGGCFGKGEGSRKH